MNFRPPRIAFRPLLYAACFILVSRNVITYATERRDRTGSRLHADRTRSLKNARKLFKYFGSSVRTGSRIGRVYRIRFCIFFFFCLVLYLLLSSSPCTSSPFFFLSPPSSFTFRLSDSNWLRARFPPPLLRFRILTRRPIESFVRPNIVRVYRACAIAL